MFLIQIRLGNIERDLQDGGGVRCGDHLPSHKYIRNISTCGTTPKEHLLNTGRRPQTSQKARNSPRTWVGQKKKEKTKTEQGWDLHQWWGAVKEEKFLHARKPLCRRRLQVAEAGSFGATKESAVTGVRRAKRKDSRTKHRCQPALTRLRGLSAHPLGRAGAGS